LRDALEKQGLTNLFHTYMGENRTLANMTLTGVMVDEEWVLDTLPKLKLEEERLEQEVFDMTGIVFNIGSSAQLGQVLYEELRFPVLKETPGGKPGTGKAALKELRTKMVNYPEGRQLLDLILEYRVIKKMRGTYLEPYLTKHRGNDGRIHPTVYVGKSYDGGTRTGRLSMSNPNLQNVPRDPRVKGAFIPTEGMLLFDADYAQVELRVAAWLAGEQAMLEAFTTGVDIHTATLAEVEGRPYAWVHDAVETGLASWKKKRTEIKAANFLVLYGGGPYQLVQTLRDMGQEISMTRAKDIIDRWYQKYWRIGEWVEGNRKKIVRDKKAINVFGQKRRLPDAGFDSYQGQQALRQGINFLVQSVAAKLTLMCLVPIEHDLDNFGGRLLLTVHDSIMGEYYAETEPDWVTKVVTRAMTETVVQEAEDVLGVDLSGLPLATDVQLGLERWGE
jgi:DNA polymerase-1